MDGTITDIVKTYALPADETSALTGLIYGYREGRIEVADLAVQAKRLLTDAATCRATGLANMEARVERVLQYFRKFNKENRK